MNKKCTEYLRLKNITGKDTSLLPLLVWNDFHGYFDLEEHSNNFRSISQMIEHAHLFLNEHFIYS